MKQELERLSRNLKRVHKLLLENERVAAEVRLGRTLAPLDFFNLLTQDKSFAWLKPISTLIAEIDDFADNADVITAKDLSETCARIEFVLLNPKSEISPRYVQYLSQDPELVIAHADLRKDLDAYRAREPKH